MTDNPIGPPKTARKSLRKKVLRKTYRRFGYRTATFLSLVFLGWRRPLTTGSLGGTKLKNALAKFSHRSILGTELCRIMRQQGSDKGLSRHNYSAFYHGFFGEARDRTTDVFELGIGTNNENLPSTMGRQGVPGASLRGWREYFPSARVFGADIDRNILFHGDRIDCFYCDQTSPDAVRDLWQNAEVKNRKFDLIVDDGLHTFSAGVTFLEGSLDRLKNGGIYVIEDVVKTERHLWVSYLGKTLSSPDHEWVYVELPHPNTEDNNVVLIRRA